MFGSSVADASPSNCNYCYSLQCAVRVESMSSAVRKAAVQSAKAVVTVGRSTDRSIVLQVEMIGSRKGAPAMVSYPLQDCKVHLQAVQQGKGSIELPGRHMTIQLSNCPPRMLNVFLKTLQAKLELLHSAVPSTPSAKAKDRAGVLRGLPDIVNKLSPLTVGEIRRVRRLRGIESPMAKKPAREKAEAEGAGGKELNVTPARSTATAPRRPSLVGADKENAGVSKNELSTRVQLSEEQRSVVRAVVTAKRNVFFTGSAGTGKSVVLRRIIELLPASTTFVTAATGVAASQIGGVTLHSFAGIGLGEAEKLDCLRAVERKPDVVKRWKRCSHLVIDEISMVHAHFFACMEFVARRLRGDDRPFGGIQLVITGDFLQLPPVVKGKEKVKFCFESAAWNFAIQTTILLKDVRRQNDDRFVRILNQVRIGRCPEWASSVLRAAADTEFAEKIVPTRLCTHSADAQNINNYQLEKQEGAEKVFNAEDSRMIPDSHAGLTSKKLVLKKGAQVMLNKNLDLNRGLSNGARGVVVDWSPAGFPLVKFVTLEQPIEIRPVRFQLGVGSGEEEPAVRVQLPLQLAWAISIHKSQGLTLDAVEICLQRVFADGQAYVALSRARDLKSLKIVGFQSSCVRANEAVVSFYESLAADQDRMDCLVDSTRFVIRKRPRPSL